MSNAYLLQWNPEVWSTSEFKKMIAEGWNWEDGDGWAFGSYKAAKLGDLVFIRRSGADRPGIVGFGRITKIIPPKSKTARDAVVHFTLDKVGNLDGKPLLTQAELDQIDADQHWNNQTSGIGLNDNAALKLSVLLDAPVTIRIDVPQGIRVKINGNTVHAPHKVRRGVGSY
jgi:hypothetical protein